MIAYYVVTLVEFGSDTSAYLRSSLLSAASPCACALIARMDFASDFII